MKLLTKPKAWTFNSCTSMLQNLHLLGSSFQMSWQKKALHYPEFNLQLVVHYVDIIEIVRFLIGHQPFEKDIVYAPIREYNSSHHRIYTQAHTADAWWKLQDQVPEGATVVPIQWMSDKTHLTDHKGDRYAHACYVSIMNISREVRRQNNRPATLPFAILPIVPKKDKACIGEKYTNELKRQVFHDAMEIIFERT